MWITSGSITRKNPIISLSCVWFSCRDRERQFGPPSGPELCCGRVVLVELQLLVTLLWFCVQEFIFFLVGLQCFPVCYFDQSSGLQFGSGPQVQSKIFKESGEPKQMFKHQNAARFSRNQRDEMFPLSTGSAPTKQHRSGERSPLTPTFDPWQETISPAADAHWDRKNGGNKKMLWTWWHHQCSVEISKSSVHLFVLCLSAAEWGGGQSEYLLSTTVDVCWPPSDSSFSSQAEHELRVAQTEFDRQAEVTRLLLEGISSTHVSQRRRTAPLPTSVTFAFWWKPKPSLFTRRFWPSPNRAQETRTGRVHLSFWMFSRTKKQQQPDSLNPTHFCVNKN